MTMKKILGVACVMAVMASGAAYASGNVAPKTKQEAMDQAVKNETQATGNPYLAKLEAKSREIGAKLDKFALAHLYTVREAYGVVHAVKIVRRDVDAAVKACGKDNADLKAKMDGRFQSWSGKVDPVVKQKEAEIDAAIKAQTYTKAKEVKDYLGLIQQTADYANRNLDKKIITTPEACQSLTDSMDDTENVVSTLLGEISLLPWPPESVESTPATKTPN